MVSVEASSSLSSIFDTMKAPLIALAVSLAAVTGLQESFNAEQLLGSHFGVPGLPATYDYVILGGGTAGLTLARRLAADSRFTVAVVNAGDFAEFANGNFSQVPALASMFGGSKPFMKNPLLDFDQYTTEQPVSGSSPLFGRSYP